MHFPGMAIQELAWDDIIEIGITVMAAIVFFVALQAYLRTRTTRVLLFAAGFGAYFLKGVAAAFEVLWFAENDLLNGTELLFEAAALLLFVTAIFRG